MVKRVLWVTWQKSLQHVRPEELWEFENTLKGSGNVPQTQRQPKLNAASLHLGCYGILDIVSVDQDRSAQSEFERIQK